jgi:hypothetical protein
MNLNGLFAASLEWRPNWMRPVADLATEQFLDGDDSSLAEPFLRAVEKLLKLGEQAVGRRKSSGLGSANRV